jgi:hypothetical protein
MSMDRPLSITPWPNYCEDIRLVAMGFAGTYRLNLLRPASDSVHLSGPRIAQQRIRNSVVADHNGSSVCNTRQGTVVQPFCAMRLVPSLHGPFAVTIGSYCFNPLLKVLLAHVKKARKGLAVLLALENLVGSVMLGISATGAHPLRVLDSVHPLPWTFQL